MPQTIPHGKHRKAGLVALGGWLLGYRRVRTLPLYKTYKTELVSVASEALGGKAPHVQYIIHIYIYTEQQENLGQRLGRLGC